MKKVMFIDGLAIKDYHVKTEYLSNSMLKDFSFDKSSLEWAESAKRDEEKMKPFELGTAFHTLLLEPKEFKNNYLIAPELNLRTNAGKAELKEFTKHCKKNDIKVMKNEDNKKLIAMKQSAMSNPVVKEIFSNDNLIFERSYFYERENIKFKFRPDALLKIKDSNKPSFFYDRNGDILANKTNIKNLIIDVKTIARMDRLQQQIAELKYHWQDYFYSRGTDYCNDEEGETAFIFIFVSTSISVGRYPVHVVELDEVAKFTAKNEVDNVIKEYKEYKKYNRSELVQMSLPNWAIEQQQFEIY